MAYTFKHDKMSAKEVQYRELRPKDKTYHKNLVDMNHSTIEDVKGLIEKSLTDSDKAIKNLLIHELERLKI